ncbi:VOC family protein [Arthrobacter sp. TES]|jgi:catechol 2,3-dioxygenase-like lactoylglutathione lyase family enzyme|uniref:VOC family protein n=1 Tax=Paenarthrobacter TaxID=1742992 RepID=UPI0003982612|nr:MULTISPECIES: VOC family protein [Paenarthrobacter]AOY70047.1 glyoxalase [Arthrobacter sp. ZXY-2]QOI62344.1 VOC family protein [Arthrobacter sp. TES]QSZ52960.1 glyoxalase [Paenarthrobacter ureafaciens]WOC60229.1 VOC family protein [Paenarthrobacter sp. AT5]GLU59520.1 glyoxalase [Paenarthrobacter ureafaciens]
MQLALNTATTVLPVDDMSRAHAFYAEKLGLPHRGKTWDGNDLFGNDGGAMLQLLPITDGMHSSHTALSFEVRDIERLVAEMEARGVSFQDYDEPGLKTENHICTTEAEKCAWFMDTENNILCIHETLGQQAEYQL